MNEKQRHTEIRDELSQIAPGLSNLKQEDGFSTPFNYFKELPDRVLARIAEEEQSTASVWSRMRGLLKPRYALALASVLMLIVAGVWYGNLQKSQDLLSGISQEEAFEYILANLNEFSGDDFTATGVFAEWDATAVAPVSDEELEQMMQEILEEDAIIEDWMVN
jgi:hypothetical protein